jgi:type II secretory pathway component GspD/PulD (secretin)
MPRAAFVGFSLLLTALVGCASTPPDPESEIRVERIALQHAPAEEFLEVLQEVIAPGDGMVTWRCHMDRQTNSLVFEGTANQLREIAALVARLDVPSLPVK